MEQEVNNGGYEPEEITWFVPEYEKHERSKRWYIIAAVVGVFLIVTAIYTKNFLFAGIIIIASLIIILNDGNEPLEIKISLTDDGVQVGSKFYDYDEVKDFAIVYKPKIGVKNLYFEFKSPIKPRISIPLFDLDPIAIREKLLKYLPENLERTDQSLSEGLSKLLKL